MPSDAAVEGVSGAIGGIVATVATYPLMTVNTLQATRAKAEQRGPREEEQAHRGRGRRAGTLHEMAELVREGGWGALFAGLEASLIGTTVSQGIYFYLYSLLRRLAVLRRAAAEAAATGVTGRQLAAAVDVRGANVTVGESLLVAALAGMGNVLLTNPIWMVATRMQAMSRARPRQQPAPAGAAAAAAAAAKAEAGQAGQEAEAELPPARPSILAVARQVYQEFGLPGFWNGTAASLIMVVNPTMQYALYEWLQAARARLRCGQGRAEAGAAKARPSALEVFLLSALAKTGATLLTYPMLNIKTRMYVARRSEGDAGGAHHTSILAAAAEILHKEGPGGYYRGMRTKIVQSVLAAALLFVCKEKITDLTRDVLQGRRAARKALTA
ncbi:hypothetical protein ABPG75_012809 [Micractinium tetrahymenae]